MEDPKLPLIDQWFGVTQRGIDAEPEHFEKYRHWRVSHLIGYLAMGAGATSELIHEGAGVPLVIGGLGAVAVGIVGMRKHLPFLRR